MTCHPSHWPHPIIRTYLSLRAAHLTLHTHTHTHTSLNSRNSRYAQVGHTLFLIPIVIFRCLACLPHLCAFTVSVSLLFFLEPELFLFGRLAACGFVLPAAHQRSALFATRCRFGFRVVVLVLWVSLLYYSFPTFFSLSPASSQQSLSSPSHWLDFLFPQALPSITPSPFFSSFSIPHS